VQVQNFGIDNGKKCSCQFSLEIIAIWISIPVVVFPFQEASAGYWENQFVRLYSEVLQNLNIVEDIGVRIHFPVFCGLCLMFNSHDSQIPPIREDASLHKVRESAVEVRSQPVAAPSMCRTLSVNVLDI
jgi:hypothetical protein